MRKRKKRHQFAAPEIWPLDEVSTRNCYHCLAPRTGIHIRCRLGHQLHTEFDRHYRQITYNGVVKLDRLLNTCLNCPDFDNDWR